MGGLTPPGHEPRLQVICYTHCTPLSSGTSKRRPLPHPPRHPSPTQGQHHSISHISGSPFTQVLCSWHLGLELSLVTGFSDRERGSFMHFHTPHPKWRSTPHSTLRDANTVAAPKWVWRVWCVAGSNPNLLQGFKYPLEP